MSIEIKYTDNGTGVIFYGKGRVTGKEIIEANFEVFASKEKAMKYKYGIVDFSGVDELTITDSEMDIIVNQNKEAAEITPGGVIAAIGAKDDVFGIGQMWKAYVAAINWETFVFRSRDRAEEWVKEMVKTKFGIDVTFL
ncbi:MAG: hypothetical protein AB1632_12885 [Nitrospirota bacterium]